MDDLSTWLQAQIAEDEQTARAVGDDRMAWRYSDSGSVYVDDSNDYVAVGPWGCGLDEDDGRHIAAWDPTRVLAECEAKRAIIGEHVAYENGLRELICDTCCVRSNDGDAYGDWPCTTLRQYGAMYAKLGRPGYQESWRPA